MALFGPTARRPKIHRAETFRAVVHLQRVWKPFKEEWEIAAQNDVRRQPRDRFRLNTLDKVPA
jgi:hypothetical protein